jgi:hypothetical protein
MSLLKLFGEWFKVKTTLLSNRLLVLLVVMVKLEVDLREALHLPVLGELGIYLDMLVHLTLKMLELA